MPKIQKLRKNRIASQSDPYVATSIKNRKEEKSEATVDEKLSRGQKKRQLRNKKVMRHLGLAQPDGLKQTPKKAKQDFSFLLSELESSLPNSEENAIKPAAGPLKTNKMKKSVAIRETQRMKLVQQHPSFISDPFSAMQKHIEHMISAKKK